MGAGRRGRNLSGTSETKTATYEKQACNCDNGGHWLGFPFGSGRIRDVELQLRSDDGNQSLDPPGFWLGATRELLQSGLIATFLLNLE